MLEPSPVALSVAFTILVIFTLRHLTWEGRHASAPGPWSLPLIGNLHQFPRSRPYLTWAAWGKVIVFSDSDRYYLTVS
jgi:hypothetical protein